MSREKFEPRRATTTVEVSHAYRSGGGSRQFTVSYSRLPSGVIGEVWVNSVNGKEKLVNDDVRISCIILSLLLQWGCSLDLIARSTPRDTHGRPHGFLGAIIDALKGEPVEA